MLSCLIVNFVCKYYKKQRILNFIQLKTCICFIQLKKKNLIHTFIHISTIKANLKVETNKDFCNIFIIVQSVQMFFISILGGGFLIKVCRHFYCRIILNKIEIKTKHLSNYKKKLKKNLALFTSVNNKFSFFLDLSL